MNVETQPFRLTDEYLESLIVSEEYHIFTGTTVTVCCLKLINGHGVVGESGCIDPNGFNAEKGREAARKDAINKLWKDEGYAARDRLFRSKEKIAISFDIPLNHD